MKKVIKKYAVVADQTIVRLHGFALQPELDGAIGTVLDHIGEGEDVVYRVELQANRVLRIGAQSFTVVDLEQRTTAEQYLSIGYGVDAQHVWSTRDTKFLRVRDFDLVQHLRERFGATLRSRKPKPNRNYNAYHMSVVGVGRLVIYEYHGTQGRDCAIKIINGGDSDN